MFLYTYVISYQKQHENYSREWLITRESPEMRLIRSILHRTIMMLRGFVTQLWSLRRRALRGWVTALKTQLPEVWRSTEGVSLCICTSAVWPLDILTLSAPSFVTQDRVYREGAENGDQREYEMRVQTMTPKLIDAVFDLLNEEQNIQKDLHNFSV